MATIFELPPDRFELARPVLSDPQADWAFIDAGLTGVNPTRLFIDDPERPNAALLCRTYEYFVGGAPGTALDELIRDAPAETAVWADFYGFVAIDPVWNDHLWALLPELTCIGRRSFRFDPARIDEVRGAPDRVPAGFRLVPLTAGLAEVVDRALNETIGLFWSGYDRFAEHGFGVAILDGDTPVSVTFTAAVGGGEANLAVMTEERYRRRGLATLCSQACIELTHDRGLVATWDCDTINHRSARLAQSLGFTEGPRFQEHAFPARAKPAQTRGRWSNEDAGNGIVRWRSRSAPYKSRIDQ